MRVIFLERAIARRTAAREARKIADGRRLLRALLPDADVDRPSENASATPGAAAIAAGREMIGRLVPVAALCWEMVRTRATATARRLADRAPGVLPGRNRPWTRFPLRFR